MADIFLAYRREDQERVRRFHDALNDLGFDVAWDQKILTGDACEEWILEQLIGSRVVIVCWSSGSIKSDK